MLLNIRNICIYNVNLDGRLEYRMPTQMRLFVREKKNVKCTRCLVNLITQ